MTLSEDLLHWILSQSRDVLKATFSSNKRPPADAPGEDLSPGPNKEAYDYHGLA